MKINNDAPAQKLADGEIRFQRLLPGPIERVWDYLTDPDKRARWFAGGPMELRPGGKVTFQFRHANLDPKGTPPAKYAQAHDPGVSFDEKVLRCEPPRLLSYTFGEDGDVTFELTPQGKEVLLVLTHRSRGEDRANIANYATGWHVHVQLLTAILEGTPPPSFWAEHGRIEAEYRKQL